jgi:hypothetical protein
VIVCSASTDSNPIGLTTYEADLRVLEYGRLLGIIDGESER